MAKDQRITVSYLAMIAGVRDTVVWKDIKLLRPLITDSDQDAFGRRED